MECLASDTLCSRLAAPMRGTRSAVTYAAMLVVVLCVMLPPQASAQSTNRTETSRTAIDFRIQKCTSEMAHIEGQETAQSQTVANGNLFRVRSKFHQQGKGTGEVTGLQYQYYSMDQNEFRSSSRTFYVRIVFREHLIRQGSTPLDDWFMRKTMLINVTNGHVKFKPETVEAECK
jgi:hypothetical protein